MTKTTTTPAPAAANASYLDSKKPAKLRRARRIVRAPGADSSAGAPAPEPAAALHARGPSKIMAVIEATGWLPHTTRAALTGLRKKGHVLARRDKRGDVTCYRIAEAG